VETGKRQKVLLLGIGNEYRGDDGAGLLFTRMIRTKISGSVTLKESQGEGGALMEAWQGYETVILVDAISSGAPSGTIMKIDATKQNIPAKYFRFSTHAFGLAEAIELARALKTLPENLLVYGIEGANFSPGNEITPSVERSVKRVVKEALHELLSRSANDASLSPADSG